MNTNMFAHPAVHAEPRDAGRARRAVRRAGRGLSGVRLDRQGPARRAGRRRRGGAARADAGRAAQRRRACSSPPVRPTRTSIRCASSAIDRAGAWATPSPPKRRGAARAVTLVVRADEARAAARARGRRRCEARPRCTRRCSRAPASADVVVMAAAVADYTVPAPDDAEDRQERRAAGADARRGRGTSSATSASCRRARQRAGRCWSALPPRRTTSLAHARGKLERKDVDLIVANDVSQPGVGFDVDDQRGDAGVADGAEEVPLQSKAAVAGRILDRVERLLRGAVGQSGGRDPIGRQVFADRWRFAPD